MQYGKTQYQNECISTRNSDFLRNLMKANLNYENGVDESMNWAHKVMRLTVHTFYT